MVRLALKKVAPVTGQEVCCLLAEEFAKAPKRQVAVNGPRFIGNRLPGEAALDARTGRHVHRGAVAVAIIPVARIRFRRVNQRRVFTKQPVVNLPNT